MENIGGTSDIQFWPSILPQNRRARRKPHVARRETSSLLRGPLTLQSVWSKRDPQQCGLLSSYIQTFHS